MQPPSPDHVTQAARRMVDVQLRERGIHDLHVLHAMQHVPRHLFVADQFGVEDAYGDRALPSRDGQTISQPYIVALMSELLQIEPGNKVLEIGTGTGYQTAVLVTLGAVVVTMERSLTLAEGARRILTQLGMIDRVTIVTGDGTLGYPPLAPYDRIIVTAGAPHLPNAYMQQAGDHARIVIPIGNRTEQRLTVYERTGLHWSSWQSIPCRFVPLVGEDGWNSSE